MLTWVAVNAATCDVLKAAISVVFRLAIAVVVSKPTWFGRSKKMIEGI